MTDAGYGVLVATTRACAPLGQNVISRLPLCQEDGPKESGLV